MIGNILHLLSFIIPQNAEPAVNTNTALPTRASAGFTLFQNFSTNLMESTTHNWPLTLVSRAPESSRRSQNQPTGANYSPENLDVPLRLTSLPPCIGNHTIESVEFTNNSSLASEQRVSRAAVLMHRVMEVREEEQEQFRREMNRREQEIRERRERERIAREVREIEEASRWPEQQEAITGPWCTCPAIETVINFYFEFVGENY